MFPFVMLVAWLIGARAQEPVIERAAFLQGCWERRAGTRIVEEQWQKPRARTMLGLSRTARGDTLVEYEFLRIYERGNLLVYAAQPSGQQPAEFVSTSIAENAITFANPQHDFPQRIRYVLRGDSLIARIEGMRNGQERGVDFPYQRASCQ